MSSIEFTIAEDGSASMKVKGVRGAACKPIHSAFSDDLKKIVGVTELSAVDTDEMRQAPVVSRTTTVNAR